MPPPFEPTDLPAEAITNIGYMFADILIFFIFIILLIYSYKTFQDYLIIIIVYSFSLIIGIEGLTHLHTHFSPTFELFFLIFQSGIFLLSSLRMYESKKG